MCEHKEVKLVGMERDEETYVLIEKTYECCNCGKIMFKKFNRKRYYGAKAKPANQVRPTVKVTPVNST